MRRRYETQCSARSNHVVAHLCTFPHQCNAYFYLQTIVHAISSHLSVSPRIPSSHPLEKTSSLTSYPATWDHWTPLFHRYQSLSSHQYTRTPAEVKPHWFLLFSLTSSSDAWQAHQRHLTLLTVYVHGHLLWSPESRKRPPGATLQNYCVLGQSCSTCMNWKLVINAKSWAPSPTYWTRNSGSPAICVFSNPPSESDARSNPRTTGLRHFL